MVKLPVLFSVGLLGAFGSEQVSGFTALKQPPRTCHRPSTHNNALRNPLPSDSLDEDDESPSRRILLFSMGKTAAFWVVGTLGSFTTLQPPSALAAPPIAVIAEELGYFPVRNQAGEMVYVPRRVQRPSSDQAVELAQKLSEAGAVMYGAFWCPHCARQKELFGREAWKYIDYVECSPQGFGAKPRVCKRQDIDGYPTWVFPSGRTKVVVGGERPLEDLARQINLASFQPSLEQNVPPPLGSSSCKQ